jgi:hypothetical protein
MYFQGTETIDCTTKRHKVQLLVMFTSREAKIFRNKFQGKYIPYICSLKLGKTFVTIGRDKRGAEFAVREAWNKGKRFDLIECIDKERQIWRQTVTKE